MLKEFYDFIANRIYAYFQSISANGSLLTGETFCLKLDTEEMVVDVARSLEKIALINGNIGNFSYYFNGECIYNTYTIKLQKDEIIIAAQTEGMTSDFLCATLRNAANSEHKPILMISSMPIDSAISGSKNMASYGMPFYEAELMKEIKENVNDSTQLTNVEKRLLNFELQRRDSDVFSDKASLYEYKDLLAIISAGKIKKESFAGFRLFAVDGKSEYQNEGQNVIDNKIKENNKLFERIDRGIRFGNLSAELAKDFDEGFIYKIEVEHRKAPEEWSRLFTYAEMLAQMEKHKSKIENPLKIENEDIIVYGNIPIEHFEYEKAWLIRNEGSQTAKRRQKNILIFNAQKISSIHIRIACNTKVNNSDIKSDGISYEKDGKDIIFEFVREGISFNKIELYDSVNDVKYIFKICIIDLPASTMLSVVKHSFVIDFRRSKDVRIKLLGVNPNIIFNESAPEVVSVKIQDSEAYFCAYNQRLHLYSSEDELINYDAGIRINIDFAGISVPFIMFPDESKSEIITGRRILKDKYSSMRSFEYINNKIYSDTQEYYAKTNLSRELKIEKEVIEKEILVGHCKRYYESETVEINSLKMKQNIELELTYKEYLSCLKKNNTIPTLAYLSGELKEIARKYVKKFMGLYDELDEGDTLSEEQVNALYIGSIIMEDSFDEILLTPFHPLNVAYQLALVEENGIAEATDVIIDRLNSLNLLPYIRRKKTIYKVSDQQNSLEWKYYAPNQNKKYRGSRRFVPRLIEEKINEFMTHFRYIFEDINNNVVKINLINMGDCGDVFAGIAQYFIHAVNRNPDVDSLIKFEVNIYSDNRLNNVFYNLREHNLLKRYLIENKFEIASGIAMNTLEGIFAKNIQCYFYPDNGKSYQYAHISFYEMESEETPEQAYMSDIETGISLNGILSGVPSSKYSTKYRTGFGVKYAPDTELVEFAKLYNALIQVESSGNPYYEGLSISTQIDEKSENKMDEIYAASNWVVFVDPKVDLDFFCEKEATSDLLIIHYSDQYTSSSGYDAITVTHKSAQYSSVIKNYLINKGVEADTDDVHGIINLFNAINGDWLLRLISSKKVIKESTFTREKISIVAAIKFMLAFLKHENIVWVPISLEEMLRVSGGAGLSQGEGVLSAKNLGFEKGPTSDDLLFVGLDNTGDIPKVYLYPTEVKTGINSTEVIKKAFMQASATAKGLREAFDSDETMISQKVNRNFLMQLLVTSCKKMQVYHVDDSQDWQIILNDYRKALLNEEYQLSFDIQEILGKGAVLSFRTGVVDRRTSFKEDAINFIEVPETDEFDLILKNVEEIVETIKNAGNYGLMNFAKYDLKNLSGDISSITSTQFVEEDIDELTLQKEVITDIETPEEYLKEESVDEKDMRDDVPIENTAVGMEIVLGTDEQTGEEVIWRPNDTSQLFHTNTGIIGTMGTGKTQFTKSLITQLYREQNKNVDEGKIGILIFDYKGDYNESKQDFVEATNAKILKPYHLPFNPLALTQSKVYKPILPIHTANAFKDTLSKIYGLGPKQQDTLFQCIIETYAMCGIKPNDKESWNNVAPTFDQVYQRYSNNEDIKKNDSLATVMNKLYQFQVFESNPSNTMSLFDLLDGVVVIDLSGYDSDIQSLIIAITLDLFYTQMQAAGSSKLDNGYRQLTKLILVDEADNFMSEGFVSLKKILKEGREFGVGTILSTQFLKHFGSSEDDYSKYILTWIVHNVSDLKGSDVDFVFNTEPKSQESSKLFNHIKGLKIHHSIVKIGTNKPVYLKDKAFWELYKEIKG